FLKAYYPSIFFFDSLVLREHVPVMIELKEIFRQQDNTFIGVLNDIRNNELTQESYEMLNTRLKKGFDPPEEEGYITLTTHNSQSDEINKAKLKKLFGYTRTYSAQIQGDFPEHMYPAEAELELKEGAQVMFLKNDIESKKYFNGKIGMVTALYENSIRVKCKGEAEEIEVRPDMWKNVNYSLNEATREITEIELGSFVQYPLRLAWAITIHKSQGLTFEKLIIDAENAFANGQVYVALSRCTSLEGLVLTSPVNQKFLGAYQNLKEWEDRHHNERNLPFKFEESRQVYMQQELQNIFTWRTWNYLLNGLNTTLSEHKDTFHADCFLWILELTEKQKKLDGIAKRFREQITELCQQNSVVEENEVLQSRIKDAGIYFSTEIRSWLEKFRTHQLTTDTKKTARKIDELLNEINVEVSEIVFGMEHCKSGFMLNDYLKNWKKFDGHIQKVPGSYAQSQVVSIASKDIENAELYDRLAEMRNRIGRQSNLPLYTVFSNAAIKNVCEKLPLSYEALLDVKGFGKAKIKKYGDEVLDLVQAYCTEKKLQPIQPVGKKIRAEKKINTIEETIRLYKAGKTVEEIALERNFVVSTIEGHLAKGIEEGLVQIASIIPMEEVEEIAAHFPKNEEPVQLSAIKGSFPDDISFGRLKMVQAWLQLEKKRMNS
ncbi:MAG TPA: helix-turn-helix domain-containing protein, partial [Bacteroidia bacterium]|nr:helix-turn-helix domain-containing protein [Bacteroidia bacterium]